MSQDFRETQHESASADEGAAEEMASGLRPIPVVAGQNTGVSNPRYSLQGVAGEGALGRVWMAADQDLNREVTLKEIQPEYACNEEAVLRFLREAQVTGQLEHPNIVPVYELACRPDDGTPYYTMRFLRGKTFQQVIAEHHQQRRRGKTDRLELSKLLGSFIGICNAVAYANSRGVVHRDLKPANVVLGSFGEVLVLDWGLAKTIDQTEEVAVESSIRLGHESDTTATQVGRIMGTPAYMSPEQAAGRLELIDGRTDIYGLGAILFEVLTGRPPHDGESTQEVLSKIIKCPPPRPVSKRPVGATAFPGLDIVSGPGSRSSLIVRRGGSSTSNG